MTGLYHLNCRANRVWWLRWPLPSRVLVWLDARGRPRWVGRLIHRHVTPIRLVKEDELSRHYRCSGCFLGIHQDL